MRAPIAAVFVIASPVQAEIVFDDWSDALPVEHVYRGGWEHFVGGGVAVFDCNNDARPDIWAAGGEAPAILLENELAKGAGFLERPLPAPAREKTVGAYPLDLNGDGNLDLFVLRVGPNKVLLGDGACGFEDASDVLSIPQDDRWSTAFSAVWEKDSALPTLAIGNYVDRSDPEGPFEACDSNVVLRDSGGRYGPGETLEPGYCALSMLFSDWNRSGTPDLRISNDRHYYVRGGSEQMWRPHEGRFLDAEDGWDDISIWGMGIASRDITGDSRPDIVLTSMGDQLLQLSTDQSGFVAAPYELGTYAQRPHTGDDGRPATGWHAEFGDIDNDGLDDLFIAKGNVDQMPSNAMVDPNNLLRQTNDGTFEEVSVEAQVASGHRSRGAALVDFDLDGRLDLVVVNRRAPMELYRNATAGAGGFLSLTPRMHAPNTYAVGAWLELRRQDGTTASQEVTVGGGHAGGKAGPLHFGLGSSSSAEVRVIWPNGHASAWTRLTAGDRAELWHQPDGALDIKVLAIDR